MSQSVNSQCAKYPDLVGRTVLISGGATGIGKSIVMAFARQGANTVFVDIDDANGELLAAALKEEGFQASYYSCDITDCSKYISVINTIASEHGPITVLVNNAANDVRHSISTLSPERFDELIGVNLKHALFAAQTVAPMMKKDGGGSIINFGSVGWMIKTPDCPVYGASKAAMHGLTRNLARDFGADGIRVNTLIPGWVMTEKQLTHWVDDEAKKQIKQSQCMAGEVLPEHIASMTLFLASREAVMCSAQSFIVDGGWV